MDIDGHCMLAGSAVDDLNSKTVANLSAEWTAQSVTSLQQRRSNASRAGFLSGIGMAAAQLSGFKKLPPLSGTGRGTGGAGETLGTDGLPIATLLGEITGSTAGFDAGLAVSKWHIQVCQCHWTSDRNGLYSKAAVDWPLDSMTVCDGAPVSYLCVHCLSVCRRRRMAAAR